MTLLFFDLTALIFIFGAELNTNIHRAALRRRARAHLAQIQSLRDSKKHALRLQNDTRP